MQGICNLVNFYPFLAHLDFTQAILLLSKAPTVSEGERAYDLVALLSGIHIYIISERYCKRCYEWGSEFSTCELNSCALGS